MTAPEARDAASSGRVGEAALFRSIRRDRREPSGGWFVWTRICVLIAELGDAPARHQTGE
jgi:hypothetical protein